MTPNVRCLPFYSFLLFLLWSPILPKPQARLATSHHFLDLAYTLFPLQVLITQFISLAHLSSSRSLMRLSLDSLSFISLSPTLHFTLVDLIFLLPYLIYLT